MSDELIFYFENLPVGYFEEGTYPTSPGIYGYMPYRGPGHYNLQVALKSASNLKCYYHQHGYVHSFYVVSCPKYGQLDITEFSDPQKENS